MFQELLNIYTPLVLGIILGVWLKPGEKELTLLAKIVLYVFLPSLLFTSTYSRLSQNPSLDVLKISFLSGLSVLATYLLTRILKEPEEIVLTSMYANAGYLPLGVAQSLYGENGVASVGFYILGNNSTSNFIAPTLSRKNAERVDRRIFKVITFPPIIAITLGFIIGIAGIKLPTFIQTTLKPFSDSASTLALLELGVEFGTNPSLEKAGLKAYFYRLAGVIPLTLLFTQTGVLSGVDRGVALIESIMPSAVSCLPISRELGLDSSYVARIIFTSTLLATTVSLPIMLYLINAGV